VSAFGWYRPWLTDVQASKVLSSKAKLAASVLATSERNGTVRKSSGQLGELASLSEKTIRRALRELAADGWLTVTRKPNHLEIVLVPRPSGPSGSDTVSDLSAPREN